jgi:hypothetical protein
MTEEVGTTAYDLGLGVFILPQPKDAKEYVNIPRLGRTIPFGYVADEADDGWLVPVPLEIEALEKAKKHLKQYSLRQVSAWLTTVTGREISHVGLMKRIKSEQSQRRKSSTYRELADRYEKALKKAQEYEKRTGTGQDSFFGGDRFVQLSATFSDNSTDS